MKSWVVRVRNEKGVALPLALFVLVSLSAFVLAFLSMGGMEPQVARNLSDSSQARYAAEAGLEAAFDQLASAPGAGQGSWTNLLQTNIVAGSNPQAAWLTGANGAQVTLPGLAASFGTYTVQIRNDSLAADQALTGVAPELGVTNTDNNGTVIVTAAGTYNGVTRQIQVVMRRLALPPFPAAFSMPGAQVDIGMSNSNATLDGRDYVYQCTAKCTDPDLSKQTWDYVLNTDPKAPMKYGLAVQPGNQQNLSPATTYEANVEAGLGKNISNVWGKSQLGGASAVNGANTVAPDSSLGSLITRPSRDGLDTETTPKALDDFLTNLQKFSGTTVLQSSLSCAQKDGNGVPVGIWMTGDNNNPSKPTLSGCVNQTVDLGDRNNPKLVYFRGDRDPSSSFAGVVTTGQLIKGAGILIVEDGDFRVRSQFDWDGVVIVTGRYVTFYWENSSKGSVNGAAVSNETMWNESGNSMGVGASGTLYDALFDGANATNIRYSQQMLNMVQRSLLFRMSTWREI